MKIYHNYYYTLNETTEGGEMLDTFTETFYGEPASWYEEEDDEGKAILEELWTRLHHMFKRKGVYFNILDVDFDLSVVAQYISYLHYEDSEMRIDDFLQTIGETKEKYIKVLKEQENLKSALLNDLENVSEHYYNDTPQTNGNYINNNYTSNYSKDVQKIDLGPVSSKLEEVELAMEDKYELWLNHFKKFIILEG